MFNRSMITIYLLLGLVLLQYQNCAAPESNLAGDSTSVESAADVSVINQVEVGEIFFPEKTIHAASLEAADLVGVCEQSGAIISWTLRSHDGLLIERGSSECDRGAFEVVLTSDVSEQCAGDLQLKAALGAKASSEVTILTDCSI